MKKTQPLSGLGLIAAARMEQIFEHGYSVSSDANRYISRDVFQNCAVAIIQVNGKYWPDYVPTSVWENIMTKSRKEQLAIAASFLAAEIDYLEYRDTQREWKGAKNIPAQIGNTLDKIEENIEQEIADMHKAIGLYQKPTTDQMQANARYGQRPPLGLVPRWLHVEQRLNAIDAAMDRFNEAGRSVPAEWKQERDELTQWIEDYCDNKDTVIKFMRPAYIKALSGGTKSIGHLVREMSSAKALDDWRKRQTDLSRTDLRLATAFLRDKGMIAEGNNIFVIVMPRKDGKEHINLAQLMMDFVNTTPAVASIKQEMNKWRREAELLRAAATKTADTASPIPFKAAFKDTTDADMLFEDWKNIQIRKAATDFKLSTSWLQNSGILKTGSTVMLLEINGQHINLASLLDDYAKDAFSHCVRESHTDWLKKLHDEYMQDDDYTEWDSFEQFLHQKMPNAVHIIVVHERKPKIAVPEDYFMMTGDGFDALLQKTQWLLDHNKLGDHFHIYINDVLKQLKAYQQTVRNWRERTTNSIRHAVPKAVREVVQKAAKRK